MTPPVYMDPFGVIVSELPPPRLRLTEPEREAEALRLYGPTGGPFMLRNIPGAFDLEITHGVTYPHPSLQTAYESGCAEPWTTQVVTSLLIASNERNVLETGCFTGQTSAWLACALERVGGGTLTTVDIDPARTERCVERIKGLGLTRVEHRAVTMDVLQFLPTLPDNSVGFAWIDDNHEKAHVEVETRMLWEKLAPKGIATFHDVWGSCDLQTVVKKWGGMSLNLPRLGMAGGIGILQKPSPEMYR